MSRLSITPTGNEVHFGKEEIIVSKTDLTGKIMYANKIFLDIAGYTEEEVLGKPHSLIRHPHMPRCVFKLLWDTIERGEEIFAYVMNMCKNGDHYWVFAHVTPTFDDNGEIIGYHSNRRVPEASSISHVKELYARLLEEEKKHHDKQSAIEASTALLVDAMSKSNMQYEEFIWTV